MRSILINLLFLTYAFPQAGPIQTNEQGISNYQILATPPAGNPISGKQYLYNANNILSTKDSAGSITRVSKDINNILANPDFEQNLDSYTFTAGRAVINSVTPLFDRRSVDLDTSALNDNISTIPYLIPKGLQGQTCQAEINYSGGDNNLTMQVLNADNVVIGSKVLASAIDPAPAFIVFNCPIGTATINQRTLRINIIQNSATNAVLATIDNFYLGKFQSNTMNVQGLSQWYYYSVVADINGDFPFPAPTGSINDKTLFTYSGTTLTALKPIKIDFNISAKSPGGTNPNAAGWINCFVLGINRAVQNVNNGITATGSFAYLSMTGNLILAAGDSCVINLNRVNVPYSDYRVNITATPLPQLATIVNTNTPRAGWLGQRTWASANCIWARSSTTMGAFPIDTDCVPINSGLVVNDAVTNGQLPKITLSKLPKGKVRVLVYGLFGHSTNLQGQDSYTIAINGAQVLNSLNQFVSSAVNTLQTGLLSFVFDNPSELVNPFIEIYQKSTGGNVNLYGSTADPLNIVVSYEPDLSDPYSIPELYAALPPQVINSSGKIWRTESCYITNNGTAAMASSSCNTWVQSVSRTALGVVQVNFNTGIFLVAPQCVALSNSWLTSIYSFPTVTSVQILTSSFNSTAGDYPFGINCQGLQ